MNKITKEIILIFCSYILVIVFIAFTLNQDAKPSPKCIFNIKTGARATIISGSYAGFAGKVVNTIGGKSTDCKYMIRLDEKIWDRVKYIDVKSDNLVEIK